MCSQRHVFLLIIQTCPDETSSNAAGLLGLGLCICQACKSLWQCNALQSRHSQGNAVGLPRLCKSSCFLSLSHVRRLQSAARRCRAISNSVNATRLLKLCNEIPESDLMHCLQAQERCKALLSCHHSCQCGQAAQALLAMQTLIFELLRRPRSAARRCRAGQRRQRRMQRLSRTSRAAQSSWHAKTAPCR